VTENKISSFNLLQKKFIQWAVSKKRWLLRAPAGGGKTMATMGLFLLLREKLNCNKLLVVTRAKAMVAFSKANCKKLLLFSVCSEKDMAVLYSGHDWPAEIYLVSDSVLSKIVLHGTLAQKTAFTELLRKVSVLVFDESHLLRVYDSARTKAFRKVSHYYGKLVDRDPEHHRIGFLSATPMYKNLENYHSIFSCLCNPNPLGSWQNFMDRYCISEQQVVYGNKKLYSRNGSHTYKDQISFTKIIGYKNVEDLHARIDPYIFSWDQTGFSFKFNLHYYSLNREEWEEYQRSIKGLGLDKTFAIDLDVGGSRRWLYRDKSDVLYSTSGEEISVGFLVTGMTLRYYGVSAMVRGIYSRNKDAGYAVRAMKAQQCNSRAEQKLSLLVQLIKSKDVGALVFFNFLDSVDAAYKRLCAEFPGRRVAVLTGKTQRFSSVASSLGRNDIVLMSSVASQSLDMYIPRLIVMESFALTPGKIEQLCGRMTRENADYREVSVDFILREGSNVETYFYEKLRLRLKHDHSNAYVKKDSLPVSECLRSMPEELIDDSFLKDRLLWNGA
jgi:superfamily II DNA or RNA helicase